MTLGSKLESYAHTFRIFHHFTITNYLNPSKCRQSSVLGFTRGRLVSLEPFAGLGDHRIVTTLCPSGKERMRRLMELVRHGRLDLRPLLTHTFPLDRTIEAYELFGQRKDGVIKVAIQP